MQLSQSHGCIHPARAEGRTDIFLRYHCGDALSITASESLIRILDRFLRFSGRSVWLDLTVAPTSLLQKAEGSRLWSTIRMGFVFLRQRQLTALLLGITGVLNVWYVWRRLPTQVQEKDEVFCMFIYTPYRVG